MVGVPRVNVTQDPRTVESGMTRATWSLSKPQTPATWALMMLTPRARGILLLNHLYPGYHWSGCLRANTQRTNLNELWGHCIDGRATIQKSPAALTINLDPGYVLRSILLIKWIGVQDGKFFRCLQAWETSSGDASWATTGFWGAQPPLFAVPSFTFKLTLWQSCWDPSDNLSWNGQDYHIQNNFNFSFNTAWPCWQNRWYILPTDLLLQLHLRFLHPLQLKTQSPLPLLTLHLSLLQLQCLPL